ncbi:class I SAM-dependent methyltransferase [Hymenobacter tibetensis]|uniref:Class I SAM-dependent methyltransferase n=1 Tax=Hymenobacter tibetensis TaxID=497967 RepID=A0ABY4CRK3_9BACT|nr:class I SAM-dependent methyltransferase [Hymenobacter tibetensis]UOG72781.1 class I SAM-dependent methyltransferase [Hymenobacter tibetensis]
MSPTSGYHLVDGISMLHQQEQDYNPWFEEQYSATAEPWNYSRRGGELFRHAHTIELLRRFCPHPSSLLELGCSQGLMTAQLVPFTKELFASDVSPSAVKICKRKCDPLAAQHNCSMHYYVTTTPGLPFADDSFEVVTLCDGMIGWWFSEEQKQAALKDTYRVLRKGGYVMFTDYATPDVFDSYIQLIQNSELSVVSVSYLYDRPWYLLESVVKKLPGKALLSPIVASPKVAKLLHKAGGMVGTAAARHILIIARKE